MPEPSFEFYNILIIDFGQMGDVIMSIAVLDAVRKRFPTSRITLLIGKPGRDLLRAADVSDDQIVVDRVELRDSNKLWSIRELYRLVREIRSRKFDLVVDLNSFYETNIIGFLSGARDRLYAIRPGRSLDRLANFPFRPVPEDRSKHLTDRYFDVVAPLGVEPNSGKSRVSVPDEDQERAKALIEGLGAADKRRIGLFVGAGHPSRCWRLERFEKLSEMLLEDERNAVFVFLGPEEMDLKDTVMAGFSGRVHVISDLSLLTFMAMTSLMSVFVTNDTGPLHVAALAGSTIVLLIDKQAPDDFLPRSDKLLVLNTQLLDDLAVEEVYNAVTDAIGGEQ